MAKRKIILHIDPEISDETAAYCTLAVIQAGRISGDGEHYCYATTLNAPYGKIIVWAGKPNANGTQRFDVLLDAPQDCPALPPRSPGDATEAQKPRPRREEAK